MGSSGQEQDPGIFRAWAEAASSNMALAAATLVEQVQSWVKGVGVGGLSLPPIMDTLGTLLVGWMIFVTLILILGTFFYFKFIHHLDSESTADQDDTSEQGPAGKGKAGTAAPGTATKPPVKKEEVARKPTIIPDVKGSPVSVPVATGADPDAVRWTNNVFTWLYNSSEGGKVLTKIWLDTINENTVKTAIETGILVEVVELLGQTPAPVLSNVVVDCSPTDNMTITCDCDATLYLRLVTTRTQKDKTTESEYAVAVTPLRGRLNIATLTAEVLAVTKFDGWPEVSLTLEGIRNNAVGRDEQQMLDVINEVITSALRNSVLDINFQAIKNFPRFRRARQVPAPIIPVGYDSMVREIQTHPPSKPRKIPKSNFVPRHNEKIEAAAEFFSALHFSKLTSSEEQLIARNLTKYPSLDNADMDPEEIEEFCKTWQENYVPTSDAPPPPPPPPTKKAPPPIIKAPPPIIKAPPPTIKVSPPTKKAPPPTIKVSPPTKKVLPSIIKALPSIMKASPPIIKAPTPIIKAPPPIIKAPPPTKKAMLVQEPPPPPPRPAIITDHQQKQDTDAKTQNFVLMVSNRGKLIDEPRNSLPIFDDEEIDGEEAELSAMTPHRRPGDEPRLRKVTGSPLILATPKHDTFMETEDADLEDAKLRFEKMDSLYKTQSISTPASGPLMKGPLVSEACCVSVPVDVAAMVPELDPRLESAAVGGSVAYDLPEYDQEASTQQPLHSPLHNQPSTATTLCPGVGDVLSGPQEPASPSPVSSSPEPLIPAASGVLDLVDDRNNGCGVEERAHVVSRGEGVSRSPPPPSGVVACIAVLGSGSVQGSKDSEGTVAEEDHNSYCEGMAQNQDSSDSPMGDEARTQALDVNSEYEHHQIQEDILDLVNIDEDNSDGDNIDEDNIDEDNIVEDNSDGDNIDEDNIDEDNIDEDNIEADNIDEDNSSSQESQAECDIITDEQIHTDKNDESETSAMAEDEDSKLNKINLDEFTENLFRHIEVEDSELSISEDCVEDLPWETTDVCEADSPPASPVSSGKEGGCEGFEDVEGRDIPPYTEEEADYEDPESKKHSNEPEMETEECDDRHETNNEDPESKEHSNEPEIETEECDDRHETNNEDPESKEHSNEPEIETEECDDEHDIICSQENENFDENYFYEHSLRQPPESVERSQESDSPYTEEEEEEDSLIEEEEEEDSLTKEEEEEDILEAEEEEAVDEHIKSLDEKCLETTTPSHFAVIPGHVECFSGGLDENGNGVRAEVELHEDNKVVNAKKENDADIMNNTDLNLGRRFVVTAVKLDEDDLMNTEVELEDGSGVSEDNLMNTEEELEEGSGDIEDNLMNTEEELEDGSGVNEDRDHEDNITDTEMDQDNMVSTKIKPEVKMASNECCKDINTTTTTTPLPPPTTIIPPPCHHPPHHHHHTNMANTNTEPGDPSASTRTHEDVYMSSTMIEPENKLANTGTELDNDDSIGRSETEIGDNVVDIEAQLNEAENMIGTEMKADDSNSLYTDTDLGKDNIDSTEREPDAYSNILFDAETKLTEDGSGVSSETESDPDSRDVSTERELDNDGVNPEEAFSTDSHTVNSKTVNNQTEVPNKKTSLISIEFDKDTNMINIEFDKDSTLVSPEPGPHEDTTLVRSERETLDRHSDEETRDTELHRDRDSSETETLDRHSDEETRDTELDRDRDSSETETLDRDSDEETRDTELHRDRDSSEIETLDRHSDGETRDTELHRDRDSSEIETLDRHSDEETRETALDRDRYSSGIQAGKDTGITTPDLDRGTYIVTDIVEGAERSAEMKVLKDGDEYSLDTELNINGDGAKTDTHIDTDTGYDKDTNDITHEMEIICRDANEINTITGYDRNGVSNETDLDTITHVNTATEFDGDGNKINMETDTIKDAITISTKTDAYSRESNEDQRTQTPITPSSPDPMEDDDEYDATATHDARYRQNLRVTFPLSDSGEETTVSMSSLESLNTQLQDTEKNYYYAMKSPTFWEDSTTDANTDDECFDPRLLAKDPFSPEEEDFAFLGERGYSSHGGYIEDSTTDSEVEGITGRLIDGAGGWQSREEWRQSDINLIGEPELVENTDGSRQSHTPPPSKDNTTESSQLNVGSPGSITDAEIQPKSTQYKVVNASHENGQTSHQHSHLPSSQKKDTISPKDLGNSSHENAVHDRRIHLHKQYIEKSRKELRKLEDFIASMRQFDARRYKKPTECIAGGGGGKGGGGDTLLTPEPQVAAPLTQTDNPGALTQPQLKPHTGIGGSEGAAIPAHNPFAPARPQWTRHLPSYPVFGPYFVTSATHAPTAAPTQPVGIPGLNGKRLLVKIVKAVGVGCEKPVLEAYSVVEMDEPPQKFTTSVVKDTNSPFWDEQFLFDLSGGTLELLFELYDKTSGNFLGLGIVGIEELVATPSQRQIIPLQARPYEDDKVSGSLTVEFLFLDRADLPEHTLRASTTSQSVTPRGNLITTTTTTYIKAPETQEPPVADMLVNGGDGVAAAVIREIEENSVVTNNASRSTMIIHASKKPDLDPQHDYMTDDLLHYMTPSTTTGAPTITTTATHPGLATTYTTTTAASVPASTTTTTTDPALDERGRSRGVRRKRDSFFGTLKKRFSRSKVRSKSMDPGGRDSSLERDPSVGRSVSMERSRALNRASDDAQPDTPSTQDSAEPRLLSVPSGGGGDASSTRSSLSDASAISSSSTRTYVNEASTLIIETSENGVFKHYLIPLSLQQKSKWRKKGLKLHIFGEHTFIAKHMSSTTVCEVCQKNLGRKFGKQGYVCRDCGYKCHKPCHVKTEAVCPNSTVNNMDLEYVRDPREERRAWLKKTRTA